MSVEQWTKFLRGLDLVSLVGHARLAATPEQLRELRTAVPPMLEDYKQGQATEQDICAVVQAVMGPDWRPADPS